jgi:hypothetical protein
MNGTWHCHCCRISSAAEFFVFNSANYTFPVPATGIFSYSNQSPSTNKEAVFDIMYLTGQTPVLGATFPWQLVPQAYFNALPSAIRLWVEHLVHHLCQTIY